MNSEEIKDKLKRRKRIGSPHLNFGISKGAVNVFDRDLKITLRVNTEDYLENRQRYCHVASKEYRKIKKNFGNL